MEAVQMSPATPVLPIPKVFLGWCLDLSKEKGKKKNRIQMEVIRKIEQFASHCILRLPGVTRKSLFSPCPGILGKPLQGVRCVPGMHCVRLGLWVQSINSKQSHLGSWQARLIRPGLDFITVGSQIATRSIGSLRQHPSWPHPPAGPSPHADTFMWYPLATGGFLM